MPARLFIVWNSNEAICLPSHMSYSYKTLCYMDSQKYCYFPWKGVKCAYFLQALLRRWIKKYIAFQEHNNAPPEQNHYPTNPRPLQNV